MGEFIAFCRVVNFLSDTTKAAQKQPRKFNQKILRKPRVYRDLRRENFLLDEENFNSQPKLENPHNGPRRSQIFATT
jgi:hypothetical protein